MFSPDTMALVGMVRVVCTTSHTWELARVVYLHTAVITAGSTLVVIYPQKPLTTSIDGTHDVRDSASRHVAPGHLHTIDVHHSACAGNKTLHFQVAALNFKL